VSSAAPSSFTRSSPAPTSRHAAFQALEALDHEVDLVIVGGGINGAGIARDAARRGLKVVVVEQNDLAFGTSSRSSKLIHGGLRYLEQYRVHLVFESVTERQRLLKCAPHLVAPLGFLFPVYEGDKQPLAMIRAGMWLYDGLALFQHERHRTLDPSECRALVPQLELGGLTGAPLYWDCATDDARLTLETAIDATRHGAIVCPWTKAIAFERGAGQRIRSVVVKSVHSGDEVRIRTRGVINATGPWADDTLETSRKDSPPLLRTTKGIHIVVDSARLNLPHAVVCRHPDDSRVLFAIPWGDRTYIGTSDTDEDVDPSEVRANRTDVRYLLRAVESYFPSANVGEEDVIATWAGLRPLINEGGSAQSESEVSREHKVFVGDGGMVTVAGGKLTTYRKMAAEVVDAAVQELKSSALLTIDLSASETETSPLPGGIGFDGSEGQRGTLAAEITGLGIESDIAIHLVATYGSRAIEVARLAKKDRSAGARLIEGRPEIVAQVDFAMEQELAGSACDVLCRRTQISLRDHQNGLSALDTVVARMQSALGWSSERAEEEKVRYRHEVALQTAWRAD
jgi:glycerol-3-phosphate dehydrogenase